MTYMRGLNDEMQRVPERSLDPPDDAPAFSAEQLEAARDEIIECVLLFGEWPQPRKTSHGWIGNCKATREFDLYDFLAERTWEYMTEADRSAVAGKGICLELSELLEYLILSLTDRRSYGAFSNSRDAWEKKITLWLIDWFDQSVRGRVMVEDRAAENLEDENA